MSFIIIQPVEGFVCRSIVAVGFKHQGIFDLVKVRLHFGAALRHPEGIGALIHHGHGYHGAVAGSGHEEAAQLAVAVRHCADGHRVIDLCRADVRGKGAVPERRESDIVFAVVCNLVQIRVHVPCRHDEAELPIPQRLKGNAAGIVGEPQAVDPAVCRRTGRVGEGHAGAGGDAAGGLHRDGAVIAVVDSGLHRIASACRHDDHGVHVLRVEAGVTEMLAVPAALIRLIKENTVHAQAAEFRRIAMAGCKLHRPDAAAEAQAGFTRDPHADGILLPHKDIDCAALKGDVGRHDAAFLSICFDFRIAALNGNGAGRRENGVIRLRRAGLRKRGGAGDLQINPVCLDQRIVSTRLGKADQIVQRQGSAGVIKAGFAVAEDVRGVGACDAYAAHDKRIALCKGRRDRHRRGGHGEFPSLEELNELNLVARAVLDRDGFQMPARILGDVQIDRGPRHSAVIRGADRAMLGGRHLYGIGLLPERGRDSHILGGHFKGPVAPRACQLDGLAPGGLHLYGGKLIALLRGDGQLNRFSLRLPQQRSRHAAARDVFRDQHIIEWPVREVRIDRNVLVWHGKGIGAVATCDWRYRAGLPINTDVVEVHPLVGHRPHGDGLAGIDFARRLVADQRSAPVRAQQQDLCLLRRNADAGRGVAAVVHGAAVGTEGVRRRGGHLNIVAQPDALEGVDGRSTLGAAGRQGDVASAVAQVDGRADLQHAEEGVDARPRHRVRGLVGIAEAGGRECALPQMQFSGPDAVVVTVGIQARLVFVVVQIQAARVDAGILAGGGQRAGAPDPQRAGDADAVVRLVEDGPAAQLQDQVPGGFDGGFAIIGARAEAVEIQRVRGGIIAHGAVLQHVAFVFLCDLCAQNPDVVADRVGLLCPCAKCQAGETTQEHQQR